MVARSSPGWGRTTSSMRSSWRWVLSDGVDPRRPRKPTLEEEAPMLSRIRTGSIGYSQAWVSSSTFQHCMLTFPQTTGRSSILYSSIDLNNGKILQAAGRSDLNFVHFAVKASPVHCFLLTFERSKREEHVFLT
ncbi:hypothetical protein MUK42_13038 [Musa troglodytarum]|uniref:Uncharacterized protein n=1 Tax=Musa troglodytarum TaxID=320322 RepID=A0A9E7G0X7_9LILI|nr:hypothetical protein MUK42_13038 [Musa troglodytarum]